MRIQTKVNTGSRTSIDYICFASRWPCSPLHPSSILRATAHPLLNSGMVANNAVPTIQVITTDASEHDLSFQTAPPTPTIVETSAEPDSPVASPPDHLSPIHIPPTLLRVPSGASAATSSAPSSAGPLTPGLDYDSHGYPPSPTVSARSSVHFDTALDLRKNVPDSKSGMTSLDMLRSNTLVVPGTGRKSSWTGTDISVEGTEPDQLLTPTLPPSTDARSDRDLKVADPATNDDINQLELRPHLDPSKDVADPTPFAFPPVKLAGLVDPKNFDQVGEWGGTAGILKGLGTDNVSGLISRPSPTKDTSMGSPISDDGTAVSVVGIRRDAGKQAFSASFEDRTRVYGPNVIPERKSKSLLALMWMALKDRVLVSLISLLFSLSSRFTSPISLIFRSYFALLQSSLSFWVYTKISALLAKRHTVPTDPKNALPLRSTG